MNKARRQQIGHVTDKVRALLRLDFPSTVDQLTNAVSRLGGDIRDVAPTEATGEASILKSGSAFQIRLRTGKPELRRAFSIAHALGHLFLHMGFGRPERWNAVHDYVESYARSRYIEEEFEANAFAVGLLMPANEFRAVEQRGLNLQGIADHFGVSCDAALNRGRWLGLYPWS